MLPLLIAAGLAIGGVVIVANWDSIANWLKDFDEDDIRDAINRVIDSNILDGLIIDDEAKDYLIKQSNHDLRYVYNLIEVSYYAIDSHHITLDLLVSICGKGNIFI